MIRYTHTENQSTLAPITLQAYMLGLITADDKLCYEKGGRGTATVIRLVRRDPETENRHPQMRPQWVPEFGYKDGPSVVGNALVNVSNVLYSLQKQRDDADRAAQQQATESNEDPRYYWDRMDAYEPGYDVGVDFHWPYGRDTARIIDTEAGVIAYAHTDHAAGICAALGAARLEAAEEAPDNATNNRND